LFGGEEVVDIVGGEGGAGVVDYVLQGGAVDHYSIYRILGLIINVGKQGKVVEE
jgi:hypothetical protein